MSSRDDERSAPAQRARQLEEANPAAVHEFGLPLPGQLIAGKYRIDMMIGRGGMGAVFQATHVLMRRPVAVKWLLPDLLGRGEARERFFREAQVVARIQHPNVVDVYDVGSENGAFYMVMELLAGESLEALIERGQVTIPDLLHLLLQAMRGVAAAHSAGIVHRDIKPENIFVVSDATQPTGLNAKVLDFGISKLEAEATTHGRLTQEGVAIGTPVYMSLEQINGVRDVDRRTDVYAFGVLLYRALTGRLPFDGETFAAIAVAIASGTPPTPKALRPDLPRALNDLVVKAMARQREDRYASLEEMLTDLAALSNAPDYLAHMTQPSALPPTSLTPVSRVRPRSTPSASAHERDSKLARPSLQQRGAARPLWLALGLVLVAGALAMLARLSRAPRTSDAAPAREQATERTSPSAPTEVAPHVEPTSQPATHAPEPARSDGDRPASSVPRAPTAPAKASRSTSRPARPPSTSSSAAAANREARSSGAPAAPAPAPVPAAAGQPVPTPAPGAGHRSGGLDLNEL